MQRYTEILTPFMIDFFLIFKSLIMPRHDIKTVLGPAPCIKMALRLSQSYPN